MHRAQISFGPISWLMVGEVFPLAVRGQASAVATMTNFASNFGVRAALFAGTVQLPLPAVVPDNGTERHVVCGHPGEGLARALVMIGVIICSNKKQTP